MLPENQVEQHQINPPFLVDEVSDTEYYIGTSRNFSEQTQPKWRIQRIQKRGTVWYFEYPDGDQAFKFQWSNRFGYTYSS